MTKQLISTSTRITKNSENLIDSIFTNIKHKIVDCGVQGFGLSDHSLVYCVVKSGLIKVLSRTVEYRSSKSYNKQSFVKDLNNVPWYVAFNNTNDLDNCVSIWNKLFLEVAEEHAPTKTRRIRGAPTPWMSSKIFILMKDRDYHLKAAKGNKCNSHWNSLLKK